MQPLSPPEQSLHALLKQGQEVTLDALGGVETLRLYSDQLSASPWLAQFIKLLLPVASEGEGHHSVEASSLITSFIANATDEFAISEVVEVIDDVPVDDRKLADDIFQALKSLVQCRDISPMVKSFALDGIMRFASRDSLLAYEVASLLLRLDLNNSPTFLKRVAKALGVFCAWRSGEQIFIDRLVALNAVNGLEADVAIELGLAKLGSALQNKGVQEAQVDLHASKFWFQKAIDYDQTIPETHLYIASLDILAAEPGSSDGGQVRSLIEIINKHAFEIAAWHKGVDDPPWLQSQTAQALCWQRLSMTLSHLFDRLDEPSWWEPGVAIEQCVLPAYYASRNVFGRTSETIIESIVRPRIEKSMVGTRGQAFALKQWIREREGHDWSEAATELAKRIDELVLRATIEHPIQAATDRSPVAALLQGTDFTEDEKRDAFVAIRNAWSVYVDSMNDTVMTLISDCISRVRNHPDYKQPEGQKLFGTVLLHTLSFLSTRIDATKQNFPNLTYLFEPEDGVLPLEGDLHDDYFQAIHSRMLGTGVEVSDIGAGRADVAFKYKTTRLVCEVKRELIDASFENLEQGYLEQSVAYQATDIRLGFLLVLDLTGAAKGMAQHLSSLIKTVTYVRAGETVPRTLVIVKVPGRRQRPSDLTRSAPLRKKPVKRKVTKKPGK